MGRRHSHPHGGVCGLLPHHDRICLRICRRGGEIVRGLTTAASIWTVAAIGLAVGSGLYFAAGASTAVIIVILAGIKPLEEAYRARNQSCRLKIEASNGTLTPDILKQTLGPISVWSRYLPDRRLDISLGLRRVTEPTYKDWC